MVSPSSKSPPEDRVLQYLFHHPEGADFATLEKATGLSGRTIVQTLAKLIDVGKARRVPLFLAVKQARTS